MNRVLDAIFGQGLLPLARHHVHLSSDVETARVVGSRRGEPVILRGDAARLAATGAAFFVTANGVWLTAAVPAPFLHVLRAEP